MEPTSESGLEFGGGIDIQKEFSAKKALEGAELANYVTQKLDAGGRRTDVEENRQQIDELSQKLWHTIPDELKNTQWFSELPNKPMFYGLTAPAGDILGIEKVMFLNNPELPDDLSGFFIFDDAYIPFVMEKNGGIDVHGFGQGEYPEVASIIRAEAILRYISCLSNNERGSDNYENLIKDNAETIAILRGNVTDLVLPQREKEDIEITKKRLTKLEEIFSESKFSPIIQADNAVTRRGWMTLGSRQKSNNWMDKGHGYVAAMEPTHTGSDITSLVQTRNTRFVASETNSSVNFSMEIAGTVFDGTLQPSGQIQLADKYLEEFPQVAQVIKTQAVNTYINMLIKRGEAVADPSLQKFKQNTLASFDKIVPMEVRQEFVDRIHGIFSESANISLGKIENVPTEQNGHDKVPEGTFDEFEAMVREDMKEGEDVERLKTRLGYEQYLLSDPQVQQFNEYASRYKRRQWADIPQRFKSGNWMEEGKVYASASYTAHVKEERDMDFSYLFAKDNDTGMVSFVKVDADKGSDPRAILNRDGTITFDGFDREQYPDAFTLEESSAVEAYVMMLEEIGQARMSVSTLKSLARLKRDYHDDIERFYKLSGGDEMYANYLETVRSEGQNENEATSTEADSTRSNVLARYERMEELYQHEPYSEILELSDTKRRRMWLDIPQRLKSGKWMEEGKSYNCDKFTIKGEKLGGVAQELAFVREADTGMIVGTMKRDQEGTKIEIQYELQNDGTIVVRGRDMEKYPLMVKAESAILVEAFYYMLEQEGQIKMSDNLYRQLSSLDRRINLVKGEYKAAHPDWTGTIHFDALDSSMRLPVGERGQSISQQGAESVDIVNSETQQSQEIIETKIKRLEEIIANYRKGRNSETKDLAVAQAELNLLGMDDPKFLLTYLDFAFKNATDPNRRERRDGVRLINTFGTYLDKLEPDKLDNLLAKGHEYMKNHRDEPFGVRRLLERARADGTLKADVPPKLIDYLDFVTKEEADRDTNEYSANYDILSGYFDNFTDEQKTEISDAIKKARRQIWDAIPDDYKTSNWLVNSKEYFQKIKTEQFAQVLNPFDHFFMGTDSTYPETRERFAAILLREGETTNGIPLVVDKFGRVEFQFPVEESPMSNLIGLAAIVSYINIMRDEQRLTQDDKVLALADQHLEAISKLLYPTENTDNAQESDSPGNSEILETQNRRAYEAYTDFLRHEIPIGILPESHELTISKIRRLWVNVPQQFKNSRWIKEGEAFHSKQFDEGTTVDFERAGVTNLEFKRNLENTDAILFAVRVGDDELIGTLNSDGTISLPGVDENDEWLPEVKGGVVESYFVMLTEQKKAFYDKSLITFIERHKQKLQALSDSLQMSEDNSNPAGFESAQNLDMTAVGNANGEIADHLTPEKLEQTAINAVKKYDMFFDNLNEEERARVFALSDEVRQELWSHIPRVSQESADVSEYDNVLCLPVSNPELSTFIAPFNLFIIAAYTNSDKGFLLGFGNNDLTDAIVFAQDGNGEMMLKPNLPDTVGLRFAKNTALALYADAQKARGKFEDSIFPPDLKKKDEELTSLFYKAIRASEEKGVGPAGSFQNPNLFYRQDTGQPTNIQEIAIKPDMKPVYDGFVAKHKNSLWNFVPQEFRTNARLGNNDRLQFSIGTGIPNDPFKDAVFTVRRPTNPDDTRLFFMLSSPQPSISGFINSDGTIQVPGLDNEKYRDGINFLNLNVLQWYMGALDETKVIDVETFRKYWQEYTQEREVLLDCLANFDNTSEKEVVKVTPPPERTPRRRLKPGEAGQELELAFDQILQGIIKTNTI